MKTVTAFALYQTPILPQEKRMLTETWKFSLQNLLKLGFSMEKSVETGRAFIFNKNTFVLHLLFGRDGFSHCGLMA